MVCNELESCLKPVDKRLACSCRALNCKLADFLMVRSLSSAVLTIVVLIAFATRLADWADAVATRASPLVTSGIPRTLWSLVDPTSSPFISASIISASPPRDLNISSKLSNISSKDWPVDLFAS